MAGQGQSEFSLELGYSRKVRVSRTKGWGFPSMVISALAN